jgi:hypothetical protein
MDLVMSAWLGALVGTLVAVAAYIPAIRAVERKLRLRQGPVTLGKREEFEERLSLIRRLILGGAIAIFTTLGYWIGSSFSGLRG